MVAAVFVFCCLSMLLAIHWGALELPWSENVELQTWEGKEYDGVNALGKKLRCPEDVCGCTGGRYAVSDLHERNCFVTRKFI